MSAKKIKQCKVKSIGSIWAVQAVFINVKLIALTIVLLLTSNSIILT